MCQRHTGSAQRAGVFLICSHWSWRQKALGLLQNMPFWLLLGSLLVGSGFGCFSPGSSQSLVWAALSGNVCRRCARIVSSVVCPPVCIHSSLPIGCYQLAFKLEENQIGNRNQVDWLGHCIDKHPQSHFAHWQKVPAGDSSGTAELQRKKNCEKGVRKGYRSPKLVCSRSSLSAALAMSLLPIAAFTKNKHQGSGC